jgi:hypothetical protein
MGGSCRRRWPRTWTGSGVGPGCTQALISGWFPAWRSGEDLDPLAVGRAESERHVRCLEEVRCYQPSTVSRRLSVVVGFYRVCVIEEILVHSPADCGPARP